MKLEVGKYYKYLDEKSRDRGVFECVKINRKKASIKQDCLLITNVPASIIYLKNVSQVFKDNK